MTLPFEDEEEDQDPALDGDELSAVSLEELEELEEDEVIGHRVVTTNDDGEDPFSSGAYFDE
ncbi:MAG: hypothetical protein WA194_05230 [Patescibacteria group bacterium]